MRIVMGLAASSLVTLQPAAAQQNPCENYQAIKDARAFLASEALQCVSSNAQKMSRGPDSASDIATAALQTCRAKTGLINDECVGSANVTARYVEEFRREAIRIVVQARSTR